MTLDAQLDRKLTYDDYVLILDDGQRHEILNGVHFVTLAPSVGHQQISIRLLEQLLPAFVSSGLGQVFHAPLDVELTPHDVVQPDLVVVLANHQFRMRDDRCVGPPDLVVEILSPSSARLDRTLKLERYAPAGVPEYWIVDPTNRVVEQFVLAEGAYQRQPAEARLRLAIAPQIELDTHRLW